MSLKNQPQELVDTAKSLIDEIRGAGPLDETIQKWVDDHRQEYHLQYGMEEGDRLLDTKSWILRKEAIALGHKKLENLTEDCEHKEDEEENRVKNLHHAVVAQTGLPELGEEKIASSEPCSALGFSDEGDGNKNPKHADLIHDVSIIGGVRTDCYRLLLQYPSGLTVFLPPFEFPGAPSVQSLWELTAGFPDSAGAIRAAISTSLDIPSEQPQFKGNDKK